MPKFGKNNPGRPKGTPNKATKDIKEAFKLLVENNLENMSEWMRRIGSSDPGRAMQLLLDVSERILPKLSRVEGTQENTGEITIKIVRNGNRATATGTPSGPAEDISGG